MLLLPDLGDERKLEEKAETLLSALARPFPFGETTLSVGASLGIGRFPEDGATAEDLLESADRAMYQVKRGRKGYKLDSEVSR